MLNPPRSIPGLGGEWQFFLILLGRPNRFRWHGELCLASSCDRCRDAAAESEEIQNQNLPQELAAGYC